MLCYIVDILHMQSSKSGETATVQLFDHRASHLPSRMALQATGAIAWEIELEERQAAIPIDRLGRVLAGKIWCPVQPRVSLGGRRCFISETQELGLTPHGPHDNQAEGCPSLIISGRHDHPGHPSNVDLANGGLVNLVIAVPEPRRLAGRKRAIEIINKTGFGNGPRLVNPS